MYLAENILILARNLRLVRKPRTGGVTDPIHLTSAPESMRFDRSHVRHGYIGDHLFLEPPSAPVEPRMLVPSVGEGKDEARLMSAATEMRLGKVHFLEHQPHTVVADIYAASALCAVALSGGVLVGALVSKVLRIMACQCPVLVLCASRSDVPTQARTPGSGSVSQPKHGRAIAEGVHALASSPECADKLGRRGRKFVLASVAWSPEAAWDSRFFSELAA